MANKIESDLCLWSLPEEAEDRLSPEQREFLEEVGRNGGFGFVEGGLTTDRSETKPWMPFGGVLFLSEGVASLNDQMDEESSEKEPPPTVFLVRKINGATIALTPVNEVFSYCQALSKKPPHIVLFARDYNLRRLPKNALIYERGPVEGSVGAIGNSYWSDAYFPSSVVFPTYMGAGSPEAKRLDEIAILSTPGVD